MGKTNLATIIFGILAVIGFSLSGYMFISYEIIGKPDNQNIVIGIWDSIDGNLDYPPYDQDDDFLIRFSDQKIINSAYITISNNNTMFSLLIPGTYKISCQLDIESIADGYEYRVELLEDSDVKVCLFVYTCPSGGPSFYNAFLSTYIITDGSHVYQLRARSFSDPFIISSFAIGQELVIEYIQT